MAGEVHNNLSALNVANSDERESNSLLAFSFDDEGNPQVVAEFASKRDKLALVQLAAAFASEISREAGREGLFALREATAT